MKRLLLQPSSKIHLDQVTVTLFDTSRWCQDKHPIPSGLLNQLLDDSERSREQRLKTLFPGDCRNLHWALAHLITKNELARYLQVTPQEIKIHSTRWGKPFHPECSFSLSHSGSWIALVIGPKELRLGLDIEQVCSLSRAQEALPYLHPLEEEELREKPFLDLPSAFIQLWTRKEAYLKALGQGLHRDLKADYLGWKEPALFPPSSSIYDLHCQDPRVRASLAILENIS